MSASPPIPLVLLIGFLGAGKTTLLRQLLPLLRAQGLSPHVILNDYRNAQVDAHQLEGLAEHVEPISGSCVCCDSRDDLLDTFARMELSSNGVVLLEANGTADAQELIEILTADRRTRRFTLPIQVSVVDAKRWQKRYWNNGMEAGQIRTASSIVLTRVEEVDSKRLAEVKADLACRNPRALLQDAEALADQLGALLRRRDQLPPRRFAPPGDRRAIADGPSCAWRPPFRFHGNSPHMPRHGGGARSVFARAAAGGHPGQGRGLPVGRAAFGGPFPED